MSRPRKSASAQPAAESPATHQWLVSLPQLFRPESPTAQTNRLLLQVEATRVQWSDGIGEGEFPGMEEYDDIIFDAAPFSADDDDIQVEQFDDGVKVPRPRKSPLFNAAKKNDTAKLAKLLDDGEDINARDRQKNTPLLEALLAKNVDAAKLLIKRGAELEVANKDFQTPLLLASTRGSVEIVEALLTGGADPEYRNPTNWSDNPPLFMACYRGHDEVIRLLVEHGADVNHRSGSGYTPIMHLESDKVEVAKYLVSRGADVNAINDMDEGMDETLKQAIS